MIIQFLNQADTLLSDPTVAPTLGERLVSLKNDCLSFLQDHPVRQKSGPEAEALFRFLEIMVSAGLVDRPVSGEELVKLAALEAQGWKGVPLALLTAPAWQIPWLPKLEELPYALWPSYAAVLFRIPELFETGEQGSRSGEHYMRRLAELLHLLEANKGSAAVRALLEKYQSLPRSQKLSFVVPDPAAWVGALTKLRQLHPSVPGLAEPFALSREGRMLKLGFVVSPTCSGAFLRETAEIISSLDTSRHELVVFHTGEDPLGLRALIAGPKVELRSLPDYEQDAVQSLLDAMLDAVVFCTDISDDSDAVSVFALNRVAPLQLGMDASNRIVSLPQVDLVLCERALPRGAKAPRLGVLADRGVSLVDSSGRGASSMEWTRESLGLPVNSPVCVSLAPFDAITPSLASAWVGILQGVPDSSLLVYSYDAKDAGQASLDRVCSVLARAFAEGGLDTARLILSNDPFPSLAEVEALLKLSDIYLDAPTDRAREGARLALEDGIPVVTLAHAEGLFDGTPTTLGRFGLSECVAADWAAYVALGRRLGVDQAYRAQVRQSIEAVVSSDEKVADLLARGAAVSALIELAYDELMRLGRDAFRAVPAPLHLEPEAEAEVTISECEILFSIGSSQGISARLERVLAASPLHARAVALLRQSLLAEDRHARVLDSLVASLRRHEKSAAHWHLLCKAFRGLGRRDDALKAIETALRIEPRFLEGWITLSDLAKESGSTDFLKELASIAQELAPSDPAVIDLVRQYGAVPAQ